jgi:hypothetical protein
VALAAHELAHAAEDAIPTLDHIAQAYRDQRARNSTRPGGDRLTQIYPDAEDEAMLAEVGYRDDFPTHYCGKVYPGGQSSEIISMGIEGVLHGLHGIDQDPDYTRFILGILASI